eukprot:TRINITY_DN12771_c0_g1_i3.p1 TRINITY_DN12771_c0_g1~~TRINITY_DN12771_c0_g1_i3.p1  ORF type:complete len:143 (-),score=8.13 TRINITY_DN12771_c0_g1_i3:95-523(-)
MGISSILEGLPFLSLQDLRFGLDYTKTTNQSIITLSDILQTKTPLLNSLWLSLRKTQICDEGVIYLIDTVLTLQYFSTLNLYLGGCQQLTDKSGEKLSLLLSESIYLSDITLELLETGMTKEGIKKICEKKSNRYLIFDIEF